MVSPFAVVACSSDDTGSTAAGDAATPTPTPTPEGGGTTETGAPDGGQADTSTPPVDSGKCNGVVNGASVIGEVAGTGTKPTPAGGTIVDGTYYLTKHEVFAPASPDANTRKRTIVFAGNTFQTHENDTGKNEVQLSGTFTTSGAAVTLTVTCPIMATTTIPYTATATTIATFSASDDVFTSTKQ